MTGLALFNRSRVPAQSEFVDFYNMLDDFFGDAARPPGRRAEVFRLDVQEEDASYLIEAELPGVSRDEVNVEFSEGRLVIAVEKQEQEEQEAKNYIHRERRVQSMARALRLSDVREEDIEAGLENGILTVRVPKMRKEDKTRRIEVR